MNADSAMIEGAFLAGFEPSNDNLTGKALLNEAMHFLSTITI
jgi:hypothetical protein